MKARIALAAALLLGSCGGDSGARSVTVGDVGSTVSDGVIAVAANIRVRTRHAVGPVRLEVRFRDAKGAEVATTRDSLPYCPPDTDCWWAATFPVDQFERGDGRIRTAEVESIDPTSTYGKDARVLKFQVSRLTDGRVRGVAPSEEGYVYLIAFEDAQLRGGMFVGVTPEFGRDVYFAASDVARLGRDSQLRAYFYPTDVPRGD